MESIKLLLAESTNEITLESQNFLFRKAYIMSAIRNSLYRQGFHGLQIFGGPLSSMKPMIQLSIKLYKCSLSNLRHIAVEY